jgi:hypothetical protein
MTVLLQRMLHGESCLTEKKNTSMCEWEIVTGNDGIGNKF